MIPLGTAAYIPNSKNQNNLIGIHPAGASTNSQHCDLKVAVVHDWLTTVGGAEKVLKEILYVYPKADVYCLVDCLTDEQRKELLGGKRSITSWLKFMVADPKRYWQYMPFMPLAIESFDLSRYDLIVSSSYAVAKGVLTSPQQLHVSYVHTPLRHLWEHHHMHVNFNNTAYDFLDNGWKELSFGLLGHYMRLWDLRSANSVDTFIANSKFVGKRIKKFYRREASVIYPPVDTEAFAYSSKKEDYYLTVSRIVPYKKIDLIADAFAQLLPGKQLVIIGEGELSDSGSEGSSRPNVKVLGHQPFNVVRDYMQNAKAFVFAAEEDFGIAPVEAQACGTPVIAFAKGGCLETVFGLGSAEPTGVFFKEQTMESIADAVLEFEANAYRINLEVCRKNAERFSKERFRQEFESYIAREWLEFSQCSTEVE